MCIASQENAEYKQREERRRSAEVMKRKWAAADAQRDRERADADAKLERERADALEVREILCSEHGLSC